MNTKRIIRVDKDKCNNCHACISVCPVKNCIDASGDVVEIIDERCLACGRCIRACRQGARAYSDDADGFFADIGNTPLVIIIAPAAASVFPALGSLIGYFSSRGVRAAFDVSFGAELTARSIIETEIKRDAELLINSSCPVIVTYCEVYKPQLLPYLSAVQSPMVHTAIMIREFFPEYADCKIAAISPCAAKKREFNETGFIDYNVTVTEIKKYFERHEIDISAFPPADFTGPKAERGVSFSTPGGMHDLMLRDMPTLTSVRRIQGISTYTYLNELLDMRGERCNPLLVDCLNCALGCNGGMGTPNHDIPLERIEYPVRLRCEEHIKKYREAVGGELDMYWKEGLYNRTFHDKSAWAKDIRVPSEEQLRLVFKEMGKSSAADILNCSACGYESCAGMAEAIFNNLNRNKNCTHYLRVKAESASRTKSDFLATMSHEIRTPLNSIIGLTEIELHKTSVPENVKENLEKILNSGSSLLAIINDILDISKIETGKFDLIPERYETASLINDSVQINILRAEAKPIQFILNVAGNIPAALIGDELRVKQVVNNLLTNAFKYTRRGTVTLDIRFETAGENKGERNYLIISVEDTGIGIQNADIQKLFSDYSQLDMKANRRIEGTGLGLAITKRLTDMMNGSVTVESVYGEGSRFTVRLEQIPASDACIDGVTIENLRKFKFTARKMKRGGNLRRVQMPYGRVLVVDDAQTNLDVARGLIAMYGIRVDTASSGSEAVYLIKDENVHYDAVFIDYMMPVMDGLETARAIKSDTKSEYLRALPLIALTADALSGSKERFIENGFSDFITKPINVVRLDEVLHKFVYNREKEAKMPSAGAQPIEPFGDRRRGGERRRGGGLPVIEGVRLNEALARFGSAEICAEIITSYIKNTPPLLEQIRFVEKERLADYAVIVHGIKGTSRAIGAEDAGNAAETLEHAAREGSFEYCVSHNAAFIALVEKLIENLKAYIGNQRILTRKPEKDMPDAALLGRLKAACGNYDMSAVDAIMDELERYSYRENAALVEKIRDAVNTSDFSRAASLI
jgi:signal transduction histidine kinase/FixJ family two-component response regulator/NAD-dependent dihydropyrimidine dehydrogenase PreA subunit/HPt (histidine-containing phosphotransfer) domain-containing protein